MNLKFQIFFICVVLFSTLMNCKKSENKQKPYEVILQDYLKRESQGEFLKYSSWIENNISNYEKIPGFDAAVIIKNYRFEINYEDIDSVSYFVYYEKIADMLQNSQGSYLNYDSKVKKVEYLIIKNNENWKIIHPLTKSHILYGKCKSFLLEEEKEKLNKFMSNFP